MALIGQSTLEPRCFKLRFINQLSLLDTSLRNDSKLLFTLSLNHSSRCCRCYLGLVQLLLLLVALVCSSGCWWCWELQQKRNWGAPLADLYTGWGVPLQVLSPPHVEMQSCHMEEQITASTVERHRWKILLREYLVIENCQSSSILRVNTQYLVNIHSRWLEEKAVGEDNELWMYIH